MKRTLWSLFVAACCAVFCGCEPASTGKSDGKLQCAAGLPPVAYLVNAVGGSRVAVATVLPEGRTPHDFAPRTQVVRQAAQARIFFTTGMQFEKQVSRFVERNGASCDLSRGVKKIHFTDGREGHHHCADTQCASHDEFDPHFWLSPGNAAVMADNIAAALAEADPAGKDIYAANCAALKARLAVLDENIRRQLTPYAGKTFFVYHPAFGYFADAYNLKQRAVELNGREASVVQLAAIIKEAKAAQAATVFVQKQFNPRTAQALADKIGGNVEYLDPLEYDLEANLRKISAALHRGFSARKAAK